MVVGFKIRRQNETTLLQSCGENVTIQLRNLLRVFLVRLGCVCAKFIASPNLTNMLRVTKFSLITTLLAMILTPDITRARDETHQQVPLFDDGVMIRVPVNAFGKTLYFLLDTGFTVPAIDAKYKSYLGESIRPSLRRLE